MMDVFYFVIPEAFTVAKSLTWDLVFVHDMVDFQPSGRMGSSDQFVED